MNREIRRISKDGWDEQRIDERTLAIVDSLIEVWRVPARHEGKILDSRADERTWVELKHIVAAGLLKPGTRLRPRPGSWRATEAVVTRDGALDIDGKKFQSRSGAGRYVKGAVTNGWSRALVGIIFASPSIRRLGSGRSMTPAPALMPPPLRLGLAGRAGIGG